MDFSSYVENIKSKLKKEQLKTFDSIICFDKLHLASLGSNDIEGYQVFTPEHIVKQMVEAIGEDVLDFIQRSIFKMIITSLVKFEVGKDYIFISLDGVKNDTI